MANHGVGKTGRIFIGITDKETDTKRIETLDNIKAIRFNDFGVVGIEREAIILEKDLEKYQNFLLKKIEKSLLDEKLKPHLKSNLGFIQYKGKYVLMIEVSCIDGPSIYNNHELYIRNGPNLQLVDPISKEFHEVYRRCF